MSQSSTAFNNGDYDKVISTATEAIRLDPKIADAFHIRARAFGRKGDPDRAIADANEAIRLDPTDAHFFNNRGNNYALKRDYERAISDYNEAIRLAPNWAPAFFNRGVAYGHRRQRPSHCRFQRGHSARSQLRYRFLQPWYGKVESQAARAVMRTSRKLGS